MRVGRVLPLLVGALFLGGCQDLDRQILELAVNAMFFLALVQTVLMLAAVQVPSSSGWRTAAGLFGALVSAVAVVVTLLGTMILLGKSASWRWSHWWALAALLLGVSALVVMLVHIVTASSSDEAADRIAAGEPPHSRATRNATIACGVVAVSVFVAVMVS